jgi:hypothetical protein
MPFAQRKPGVRSTVIVAVLLAATGLLAYVGYAMLAFFEPPLSVPSHEVSTAHRKLLELAQADAVAAPVRSAALDRMFAASAADTGTAPKATSPLVPEEPELPVLSGISKSLNVRGEVRYRAILNGRAVVERDRIDGYTVRRISDAGVLLARDSQTINLPLPEVFYSHSQESVQ